MDDSSETPDYENDRRNTERLVIGMAIGIPILLVIWNRVSFSRDVLPFFGSGGALLSQARYYVTNSILLALATWLAWRQPILGGKILRSSAIAGVILLATIGAQITGYGFLDSNDYALMLVSELTVFLRSVAVMVLARRAYRIILVRDNDSHEYESRRFSILELMLWTAAVAGASAVISTAHEYHLQSADLSRIPAWFTAWTFWSQAVLSALPIIAIVICWKFKDWRAWIWIPSVIVALGILEGLNQFLYATALKAYTDFPMAGLAYYSRSQIITQLWSTAKSVFAALLVVYLMTKCGLRFRRSTRG